MTRRRIITTEEQDVHTRWRRYLCYLQRAGQTAKAKRRTNKRERREGAVEARGALDEARRCYLDGRRLR